MKCKLQNNFLLHDTFCFVAQCYGLYKDDYVMTKIYKTNKNAPTSIRPSAQKLSFNHDQPNFKDIWTVTTYSQNYKTNTEPTGMDMEQTKEN